MAARYQIPEAEGYILVFHREPDLDCYVTFYFFMLVSKLLFPSARIRVELVHKGCQYRGVVPDGWVCFQFDTGKKLDPEHFFLDHHIKGCQFSCAAEAFVYYFMDSDQMTAAHWAVLAFTILIDSGNKVGKHSEEVYQAIKSMSRMLNGTERPIGKFAALYPGPDFLSVLIRDLTRLTNLSTEKKFHLVFTVLRGWIQRFKREGAQHPLQQAEAAKQEDLTEQLPEMTEWYERPALYPSHNVFFVIPERPSLEVMMGVMMIAERTNITDFHDESKVQLAFVPDGMDPLEVEVPQGFRQVYLGFEGLRLAFGNYIPDIPSWTIPHAISRLMYSGSTRLTAIRNLVNYSNFMFSACPYRKLSLEQLENIREHYQLLIEEVGPVAHFVINHRGPEYLSTVVDGFPAGLSDSSRLDFTLTLIQGYFERVATEIEIKKFISAHNRFEVVRGVGFAQLPSHSFTTKDIRSVINHGLNTVVDVMVCEHDNPESRLVYSVTFSNSDRKFKGLDELQRRVWELDPTLRVVTSEDGDDPTFLHPEAFCFYINRRSPYLTLEILWRLVLECVSLADDGVAAEEVEESEEAEVA